MIPIGIPFGKIEEIPEVTIVSPSLTGAAFSTSFNCVNSGESPFQVKEPK